MHKHVRVLLSLTFVPLSLSTALAQPPAEKAPAPAAGAPMPPPKPAPEFDAFMKAGEGSWKCETTMPAGSMGPGSPEMKNKSSIKIKKALGGFGYDGEWESKKTKEMPAMKGKFVMAWDSANKQLVTTSYNSMGGVSHTVGPISGTSATLTGSGSMMGQPMKMRQTITHQPDGKVLTHAIEVDMGKGWQPMSTDTCKK